jgi:hypothetical protein
MKPNRDREPPPADRQMAIAASTDPAQASDLCRRIASLHDLTAQQLRDEWRRFCRDQPPRLSRDLLIRTIAYRYQELAYGGLTKAIQRKLVALTRELATGGSIVVLSDFRLRPGARLVREWRGKTHMVIVTEEGFEYAGQTYASLTKIAHAITGAHWSGPRFFGLNREKSFSLIKNNREPRFRDEHICDKAILCCLES